MGTNCPFCGGEGEGGSFVNVAVEALVQCRILEVNSFLSCIFEELIPQKVGFLCTGLTHFRYLHQSNVSNLCSFFFFTVSLRHTDHSSVQLLHLHPLYPARPGEAGW